MHTIKCLHKKQSSYLLSSCFSAMLAFSFKTNTLLFMNEDVCFAVFKFSKSARIP